MVEAGGLENILGREWLPVDLAKQESWLSLPTNQKQIILSHIDRILQHLSKALVTLALEH